MRKKVLLACVVLGLLAVPVALADQSSNSQSPLFHNANGTCDGIADQGTGADGNAVAHRNPNGTVTINLVIRNGLPNTTYYPNVLCNRWFGSLTTNAAGNGAGHFVLDSSMPDAFTISLESGLDPYTGQWVAPQDTYATDVMTATSS